MVKVRIAKRIKYNDWSEQVSVRRDRLKAIKEYIQLEGQEYHDKMTRRWNYYMKVRKLNK